MGPTTAEFQWTPSAFQMGVYPDVHFEVSDGVETDTEEITITVSEAILLLGGRIATAEGVPVSNGVVTLFTETGQRVGRTRTGSGGRYSFQEILPGTYRVAPRPTSEFLFEPEFQEVELLEGSPADVAIALFERIARARGLA